MSRPSVMTGGFHPHGVGHGHGLGHGHGHSHGHGHAHLGGHYGVHAQSAYGSAAHSGLTFGRPLPSRAPAHPPAFNHHHTGQHQHSQHSQHGRASTFSMADPAFMTAEEEHAYMQKLASEYEPEATGPLVGERQSSAAITTEYANADPVYRIKTAALPGKYAYFRTCRGDGHCGWRAIAFTYFEALLRLGDSQRFAEEEGRLISMGNLLDNIGYSRDIWIDFADEAFDLLRKLGQSVDAMDGTAADMLLAAFNDVGISMAIITYFKLLASAWVQNHAEEYRHFVPMGDVKAYCNNNIDPAQCEADNIGVAALADALVKPAGFGLEVWYLDRSPGEEINRSYYAEPTLPGSPMLRLLYRPGHYDILYKADDVPSPLHHQAVPQAPIQVNFTNYTDDFLPQASNFGDVMSMLPGMGRPSMGWASLSYDCNPSSAQQPQATPISPYPSASLAAPPITSSLDFITPIPSSQAASYSAPRHHSIQLDQPPITLPMHPAPPPPPPVSVERTASLSVESGGPFRPSMYQLEPGFGFPSQAQPFQTSIFRNSHYNTAHFNNPEFQPEEWCPDGEYTTGNKGRHKHPS